MGSAQFGEPVLYRKVTVPDALVTRDQIEGERLDYGGDIRIGDLTGDGQADLLVFRCADGGMKPCFLGAFALDGRVLWQVGQGGGQPARPGAAAIHDIDGDGRTEVVCFFLDPTPHAPADSMANVVVQIRDGPTGHVKHQAAPDALTQRRGTGPNWVHQRILIANLRGMPTPRDLVVKLGDTVLAMDEHLDVLWTYTIGWNEYGGCSAYIPAVGDIDGDRRDEVTGGYYLLDHDGTPLWQEPLGPHMDSVAIAPWDNGRMRAICSGAGHVVDADGHIVLELGEDVVPHGQEVRVATFVPDLPGPQMIIRYNAHRPALMLVDNTGRVVNRFEVNASPNNTGMEAVFWAGPDAPALVYNGGVLWHGTGERFAVLPGLPEPVGPARMGWYHCIPADVCGDGREELVLYNPWDRFVWIYTPAPLDEAAFNGYQPGPRQYNARLMD